MLNLLATANLTTRKAKRKNKKLKRLTLKTRMRSCLATTYSWTMMNKKDFPMDNLKLVQNHSGLSLVVLKLTLDMQVDTPKLRKTLDISLRMKNLHSSSL